MGREIRMVPESYEHPKYDNGGLKALFNGVEYKSDKAEFMGIVSEEGLQEAIEYMGCPDKDSYMSNTNPIENTHFMMFETTSEGTPLSPAFKEPEELARWLADNNASSFGSSTATYEQWLGMITAGWAPSAVMDSKGLRSGVEAVSE